MARPYFLWGGTYQLEIISTPQKGSGLIPMLNWFSHLDLEWGVNEAFVIVHVFPSKTQATCAKMDSGTLPSSSEDTSSNNLVAIENAIS